MLAGLNEEQRSAVLSTENTLLIACPGSGKTRVLTRKIAYDLNKNDSRKKMIVALTFTNRAAEEIQGRIEELGIDTEQLWAGTIHSFCFQWILQPYASYINELKNGFTVADEFFQSRAINEMKEEYNLRPFININTKLNRKGEYSNHDNTLNELVREYHNRLLNDRIIDYDLIIYFSYKLMQKHPKIQRHLSRIINHIFVDEYQDTQDLQYGIIGEIVKKSNGDCKLFMVGDPDQSIYGSLGGHAKEIKEIEDEIGGFKVLQKELTGNYRSSQRVINFFSHFQSTNIKIESKAQNADEFGVISLDKRIDKNNLYHNISRIIHDNINSGVSANEICVIAPRWQFLVSLSRRLKAKLPEVPFEAPGITPLPRTHDNFWYKLSRLFLTEPSMDLYRSRMRWALQIIEELNYITNSPIKTQYNDNRKLLKLINSIKPEEQKGTLYLKKAFSILFDKLDIVLSTHQNLSEQWTSFFSGINERISSRNFDDIPDDIDYFKSIIKQSEGVVINTCHGIKGQEFETVIAFGLLKGYIPHWNDIINGSSNTATLESNKLLYVIASRAKSNIHLIAEQGRETLHGQPYVINPELNNVEFQYNKLSLLD